MIVKCILEGSVHVAYRGRHAFVTSLRTPQYLPMLREAHCSLLKHNPMARLIVVSVKGDLASDVVKGLAEYRELSDLTIEE